MNNEFDTDTSQRLLNTWRALQEGKLNYPLEFQEQAKEILNAKLTLAGLVNITGLSEEAIQFGRMAGIATHLSNSTSENSSGIQLSMAEGQQELFHLFRQLFSALAGRAVELIENEAEIRDRMLWRVKHEANSMATSVNAASEELAEFYNTNALATFRHAKTLGGMRLVTGGQRYFGPSALTAVRITSLYADTQLIPDPVYPFFAANLHLNANELQLAHALFYVLQLRPLIDADLPVHPVFIFPSFEENLEQRDAHTIHGLEQMAIQMIGPLCHGDVSSLNEIFEYAVKQDDSFAQAILSAGLFVPPGGDIGRQLDVTAATREYISALEGIRSREMLEGMKKMPAGTLILNGVLERLRPQYHLLENAAEFGAQPLLSQHVHWHYFEKLSQANAQELFRRNVLSEQAFYTLRAVQDNSLSWLANISVQDLGKLIANNEHRWLREELNKYTAQLAASDSLNTNEMIREISHGLASIVQRQHKAMNEIERKYAPKMAGVYFAAGTGISLAAVATMLPSLSPLLGVAVPTAAALGAISGGIIGFGKEKIGERTEKKQTERSIIGVLATVRPR